jgi:hypothetical protein
MRTADDNGGFAIGAPYMNAVIPILIIGLVLLVAFRIYNDWLFLRRPRQYARGTVIGQKLLKADGGQIYLPIVRFESDDGRAIQFTNGWGARQQPELGSTVDVEYPAGLPQKARIAGSYSPLLAYGLSALVLALLVAFIFAPVG